MKEIKSVVFLFLDNSLGDARVPQDLTNISLLFRLQFASVFVLDCLCVWEGRDDRTMTGDGSGGHDR